VSDLSHFVIGVALIICSLFLAGTYVEYRVEPISFAESTRDVVLLSEDEIIPLGLTTIAPKPNSVLAKYHGRIGAQQGIFARSGNSKFVAAVGGLLLPTLLMLIAIYLVARITLSEVKKQRRAKKE